MSPDDPRDTPPGAPPGPPPSSPPPTPPPGDPPSGGPPSGGDGGPKAAPRVDVAAWFQGAWQAIQPVWIEVILAVLVTQVVLLIAYALCVLPGLLLMGPVTAGLFIYLGKLVVGERPAFDDLTKGLSRFVDTTILALVLFLVPALFLGIMFLPSIFAAVGFGDSPGGEGIVGLFSCFGVLGVLLFVIVYPVVVGTFCIFAFPLVVFEGMGAIEALKVSAERVKPQFSGFLLFLAACVLVWIAAGSVGGVLACVGTLVLSPLAQALVMGSQLVAYRDFFGLTPSDLEAYR